MILKSLNIISFGGLNNRTIDLDDNVNIICGSNESGKSSAAMFIKFIFYGLSGKSNKALGTSERQRYINRETGKAAGYIMAETSDGTLYRLERAIITSDDGPNRERVRIINQTTGEIVTGQNPGEYFFGVPEDVFISTCFVSQNTQIRPDMSKTSLTAGTGSSAVDNILTSADENVDLKKAVGKLDATRREICHKNGSGGELNELREKREALARDLDDSAEKSAEIISTTTSLDDIKQRIAELEENKAHFDELFDAIDKLTVKRRIDARRHAEDNAEKLTAALEKVDTSPLGSAFTESLLEAERDLRAYDELYAAYHENGYGEPTESTSIEEADEIIDFVRKKDASSRTQFSVAIALLIAGIVGIVITLMMYIFNTDMYTLPMIMTLVLVTLGVVFLVSHIRLQGTVYDVLDEWGAETVDDIESAVYDNLTVENREASAGTIESLDLEEAMILAEDAKERIYALAETAELPASDDIYDVLRTLHMVSDKVQNERAQIVSRLDNVNGKLEVLSEQLDGIDEEEALREADAILATPEGEKAALLDGATIKDSAKERDFTENALKSALKRKSDLEEKLLELGKPGRDPAECASLINALDDRIEELSLRHDACEMAKAAILSSGETLRSGLIPRIAAQASAFVEASTSGTHERITLDNTFKPGVADGDNLIPAELLSRGTSDLSYIALRLSLFGEIFTEEKPTVILDESFAHMDISRIKGSLSAMKDSQYVLFTCRGDEANAAAELGYNVIHMQND